MISHGKIFRRNNNELVAVYGNFVNRALVLTQKSIFEGKVPQTGELTEYDKETLKEFADVKTEVEKLLNVKFPRCTKRNNESRHVSETNTWPTLEP